MRVLPILFNTDMVRAILEGRKNATRRIIKDKDIINGLDCEEDGRPIAFIDQSTGDSYPPAFPFPYQVGDILYVRETWYKDVGRYMYRANYSDNEKFYRSGKEIVIKWCRSIHMPKEAARLFLRVKDVRVERLQDITDEDIVAEGLEIGCYFEDLWDSTVKPANRDRYGWAANPWVWVIEFERISKEAALKGGADDEG